MEGEGYGDVGARAPEGSVEDVAGYWGFLFWGGHLWGGCCGWGEVVCKGGDAVCGGHAVVVGSRRSLRGKVVWVTMCRFKKVKEKECF